jgi:hypothetical protein
MLWSWALRGGAVVAEHVIADALSAQRNVASSRGTAQWLAAAAGSVDALYLAAAVVLLLGALRLSRVPDGPGARGLARGAVAGFALAVAALGLRTALRDGLVGESMPELARVARLVQLQGAETLAGAGADLLALGAMLVALPRARRAVLAVAVAVAALPLAVQAYAAVRWLHAGPGAPGELPLGAVPHGRLVAFAIACGLPALLAFGAWFTSTRLAPRPRAPGTAGPDTPYRAPDAVPAPAPHQEPDFETAAQGLQRYRVGVAATLAVIPLLVLGMLFADAIHATEFARLLAVALPLIGLIAAVVALAGLHQFTDLPRRSGAAGHLAALALLLALTAACIELRVYFVSMMLRRNFGLHNAQVVLPALNLLAYQQCCAYVLGLLGIFALTRSLVAATSVCSGPDLGPRAWLISGLVLGAGVALWWSVDTADTERTRVEAVGLTAVIALVLLLMGVVLFLALVRDAQHAMERGPAPRVGSTAD